MGDIIIKLLSILCQAPIALRLEHEMRQFFSRYPNGDNLAAHLVKKFSLEPIKAHVRAVDGLLR